MIILGITKTESNNHTWHDNPRPWVSLTWLLYNLQLDDVTGTDFEIFTVLFRLIRNEILSSMYNLSNVCIWIKNKKQNSSDKHLDFHFFWLTVTFDNIRRVTYETSSLMIKNVQVQYFYHCFLFLISNQTTIAQEQSIYNNVRIYMMMVS